MREKVNPESKINPIIILFRVLISKSPSGRTTLKLYQKKIFRANGKAIEVGITNRQFLSPSKMIMMAIKTGVDNAYPTYFRERT